MFAGPGEVISPSKPICTQICQFMHGCSAHLGSIKMESSWTEPHTNISNDEDSFQFDVVFMNDGLHGKLQVKNTKVLICYPNLLLDMSTVWYEAINGRRVQKLALFFDRICDLVSERGLSGTNGECTAWLREKLQMVETEIIVCRKITLTLHRSQGIFPFGPYV